jgi:hypothetical protein
MRHPLEIGTIVVLKPFDPFPMEVGEVTDVSDQRKNWSHLGEGGWCYIVQVTPTELDDGIREVSGDQIEALYSEEF